MRVAGTVPGVLLHLAVLFIIQPAYCHSQRILPGRRSWRAVPLRHAASSPESASGWAGLDRTGNVTAPVVPQAEEGVGARPGLESRVCPGIQIPAAPASSTTSIFGGKKQLQGSLQIRATKTLLHRLSSIAGASALSVEFSLPLRVLWPLTDDCPAAYTDLFSAPRLAGLDALTSCETWWLPLRTATDFCRSVNESMLAATAAAPPQICMVSAAHSYTPPWASSWWFRQLVPSADISAIVTAAKAQLQWDRYTWVGVHLMRRGLTLRLRAGLYTAGSLAPLSSFMYEMMLANFRHGKRRGKPLRFLILSEDEGAVTELTEMVAPVFAREQVVRWTHGPGVNITFGVNSKEGLRTAVADMFLLAEAANYIYSRYSAFAAFVRHVRGAKPSVGVGNSGGRDFSMAAVI
mmetsp:Transcript_21269/g.37871  ORF Transcript_21269/g.37871 Transcript_21269/m.37871 type:complete len:406 (-) Transcript_21269:328-1545(-)|eukprot:CAMPEP_0177778220 /NCGR_PEP_ID=MMETSP0491_2-20121128/15831_1 /TAXON_ID=63592 /ORGANISM="Tetraselmis chuii, Strain PLY429" /LENGTH=405 /DNA_ID=CAMNT_0019297465 /DNA_START=301 /DNA_END=1518 /DNA_ORIENTATION=+